MLYKTLIALKEKIGLTEELKEKIDILYLANRLTEEQYKILMDIEVGPQVDE